MQSDDSEIPFNRPYMTGKELGYILEAKNGNKLAGDGPFTGHCSRWLESHIGCQQALLTHSCTAALELAALLLDIEPGDEVIMPSFTFVSTANAFVLRGAVPRFVDIRADTLNIDERQIEAAITPRTKAIVPVHYAGVSCEMDSILSVANAYRLSVVEDAAQGAMSFYKGRALGGIGDLGALSFHETKNVISGEGGALLVNKPELVRRAEILREKGTDRSRFFRGEVDKYTWQDIGSSFLPGEITAAFLWAQLQEAESITERRIANWNYYHHILEGLENEGFLNRPVVPDDCQHNAHMYYCVLSPNVDRSNLLAFLKGRGVHSVFHYVPLHSSPAGIKFGRQHGPLDVTTSVAQRLVRLPMFVGLTETQQDYIVASLTIGIEQCTLSG